MKKSTIIIFAIAILVIIAGIIFLINSNPGSNTLTIPELNNQNPSSGNYDVNGYILKVENCDCTPPSCPNCIGKHVVVSEVPIQSAQLITDNMQLYIFTDNPNQFEIGKKYEFSVKILEDKKIVNVVNTELISSKKI